MQSETCRNNMNVPRTVTLATSLIVALACATVPKSSTTPTCETIPDTAHITYEGGDGRSYAGAVIIRGARSPGAAVTAERQWLDQHYPGYTVVGGARDVDPVGASRSRVFSTVRVAFADGSTFAIVFDISEVENACQ